MKREGWHRALDIQMGTHKWGKSDFGFVYNRAFFETVVEKTDERSSRATPREIIQLTAHGLAQHFQRALWRADCMYVTSDMLHLLMQAAHDLPADATFDDHMLICPRGFCLFEEPIVGTDRHGKNILFHAILWDATLLSRATGTYPTTQQHPENKDLKNGIIVYFLVDPTDPNDHYNTKFLEDLREYTGMVPPLTLQHFYPALVGNTIPDIVDAVGTRMITETLKLFVAMQLVAQQKIGEPIRMRPDRAQRRRYAREYHEGERLITLITLRRKSVKKDDHEPQKVEWSRRWAVQGHWRKQWYPKTKTHEYIYIHEYIKGPEDKPLVLSDRRVFNFVR